jgi:Tfp pilus assembly protein FimT
MLVVIAILILLMAAVLPALGPMRRSNNLRVGATTVAGALRSARSLAIAKSRACYVYINVADDGLGKHAYNVLVYQSSKDKKFPDLQEPIIGNIEIDNIDELKWDELKSNQYIQFLPDGSVRFSKTVKLRLHKEKTHREVGLNEATGRVKISPVIKDN